MMMGIVIGSGIFLTTGIMAQAIPSALLILLAWLVGGLLILAGALTYAELGVSLPEAGGQYVYLREAYGHLYGFLFQTSGYFCSFRILPVLSKPGGYLQCLFPTVLVNPDQ